MRLDYQGLLPEVVGFLLLPRFSMMAFFSAVEPLRIANRITGPALFDWTLISEDGGPVTASNGMTLLADRAIGELHQLPSLAVCSGFGPEDSLSRPLMAWLHRLDQAGCVLGGLDTGGFLLAEAGLLEGERVTLHWESLPAFQERFPGIETSDELYELGRRRFSCAGGTAAMDMALEVIARRHGLKGIAMRLVRLDRSRPRRRIVSEGPHSVNQVVRARTPFMANGWPLPMPWRDAAGRVLSSVPPLRWLSWPSLGEAAVARAIRPSDVVVVDGDLPCRDAFAVGQVHQELGFIVAECDAFART